MSHEIRTPMNGVIGMTSCCSTPSSPPISATSRRRCRDSGEALLTIINDILDFSKIEAGKLELEAQPFDLRECVERGAELVRQRAAEKGLDWSARSPTTCRRRSSATSAAAPDPDQPAEQRVSSPSRARCSLTVAQGDGDDELHFAVRDAGIGIAPRSMRQLFEPSARRMLDHAPVRRHRAWAWPSASAWSS